MKNLIYGVLVTSILACASTLADGVRSQRYVIKPFSEVTDTGITRLVVGEQVTIVENLGARLKIEKEGKILEAPASGFSESAPVIEPKALPQPVPVITPEVKPTPTLITNIAKTTPTPDYRAINREKTLAQAKELEARIKAAEEELAVIDSKKPIIGTASSSGAVRISKESAGSFKLSQDAVNIKALRLKLKDLQRDL